MLPNELTPIFITLTVLFSVLFTLWIVGEVTNPKVSHSTNRFRVFKENGTYWVQKEYVINRLFYKKYVYYTEKSFNTEDEALEYVVKEEENSEKQIIYQTKK